MRNQLFLFTLLLALSSFAQSFVLPKLPYAYSDYAPNIDAQTMEIHLTKHHQAYVNNLNKAIKGTMLDGMSLEETLLSIPPVAADAVRNNAGGHYNHSLFWEILAPKSKQGACGSSLNQAIVTDFGNIDSLKKQMFSAAMSRFGSGWAWLMVTPTGSLKVISTPNQDNPLMGLCEDRGIPVLGIDVWEHAYYLNYQNRRADYLTAVWDLVDWSKVTEKYDVAKSNTSLLSRLTSVKKNKKKGN
jgi:Fe-Mn family superoxide dismutase